MALDLALTQKALAAIARASSWWSILGSNQ
jgi:hypothetical protein